MRYTLPNAKDNSEQWVELKDRADITRKELHSIRLAFDTFGDIGKTEAQTIAILSACLLNWEIKLPSGDPLPRPQTGNVKQVEDYADRIPGDTWYALEDVINGTWDATQNKMVGGYSQEHLQPREDPQKPSTD